MPVEGVKHLEAKLDVHLLFDVSTLHDPKVFVVAGKRSHVQQNRGRVTEGEGCRRLKRFSVQIEISCRIKAARVQFGIQLLGTMLGRLRELNSGKALLIPTPIGVPDW